MRAADSPGSLALLVVSWFGASILAIASAKHVLVEVPCPATLCFIQFGVAALGMRQLCWLGMVGRHPPATSDAPENLHVVGVAASYTCGFLLTNAAIAVAAPSFVETFKAAEPLSTVALAFVALREREHRLTYASLLPIVVGVAIASSTPTTFSSMGMALSLLSNISFSARAIVTKALKRRYPTAAGSDAILFYRVSTLGCLMLLPFVMFETTTLIRVLAPHARAENSDDANQNRTLALQDGSSAEGGISLLPLLGWVLLNGIAHAVYNGVSFAVLGQVSVSTHAVLNMVRRVVCIAAAAVIFGTPVTIFNWAGVAIAAAGVGCFAKGKEMPRPVADYKLHGKARAV